MLILEVCVDSAGGLAAAVAGGADRIELCAGLTLGGLTPSGGFMRSAAHCGVPVVAMIRPRPGDFVYDAADLALAEAEIGAARAAGLSGVVIGANRPDGRLDDAALARLVGVAAGMDIALHRSFDLAPDLAEAVAVVARLGIPRVLTSGGAAKAEAGLDRLAQTIGLAGGRFTVMPGSGVNTGNLGRIVTTLGVREVHSSCSHGLPQSAVACDMGFAEPLRGETDAAIVAAMKLELKALEAGFAQRA